MMTRRDEANKLFPALDDSPDNMKIRLQHSLVQHDRGKQIRAINNGVAHPPFELGHNLAAADRVHSDLKAGVHVADAIDSHFPSGALNTRLHNHCGSKQSLTELFDDGVNSGISADRYNVTRNFTAEKGPQGQTTHQRTVLEVPDGSRQRPEDYIQSLVDKIAVVCRSKLSELKILQRAPGVGFAFQVSKAAPNQTHIYAPDAMAEVVGSIQQLLRQESAGSILEVLSTGVVGADNIAYRQFNAICRVLLRTRGNTGGTPYFDSPQYDRTNKVGTH